MTVERTIQGAWRVCAMVGGHLITRVYMGFTKRQAIQLFKEDHRA